MFSHFISLINSLKAGGVLRAFGRLLALDDARHWNANPRFPPALKELTLILFLLILRILPRFSFCRAQSYRGSFGIRSQHAFLNIATPVACRNTNSSCADGQTATAMFQDNLPTESRIDLCLPILPLTFRWPLGLSYLSCLFYLGRFFLVVKYLSLAKNALIGYSLVLTNFSSYFYFTSHKWKQFGWIFTNSLFGGNTIAIVA